MINSVLLLLLTTTTTQSQLINNNSIDKLTILHTNDIHSHYDPTNKFGTECQPHQITSNNCFGGVTRLKTIVDGIRQTHPNTLLLDGGDQFQGTMYYNHFKGNATYSIMNQLGYDVMTVGNHEFDDGANNLARVIKQFQFPVICANMDLSRTPELKEIIKPYIYLKQYDLAIIGYINEDTGKFLDPNLNITFLNPIIQVQKVVDELNSRGIHRIIALSHNGYEEDMELARKTRGISLIVGGHSHSYLSPNETIDPNRPYSQGPYPTRIYNLDSKPVYIVQAYCWGRFLGHLDIQFNPSGYLNSIQTDLIELIMDIPEDPNMVSLLNRLRSSFQGVGRRRVGETTGDFRLGTCSNQECAMGNLLTDAMLLHPRNQSADIALINSSGIRATFSQGPITLQDVLSVLPFDNHIVQFDMTGQEIWSMLQSVLLGHRPDLSPVTSFIQLSGLHFTYLHHRNLITEITIFHPLTRTPLPLNLTLTNSIVTADFIANGGDNLISPPRLDLPPQELQSQGLIDYLSTHSPVRPTLNNRINALPSSSSTTTTPSTHSRQIPFQLTSSHHINSPNSPSPLSPSPFLPLPLFHY